MKFCLSWQVIQHLGLVKAEAQLLVTFLVRQGSPTSASVGGELEQQTATMAEMLLSHVKVYMSWYAMTIVLLTDHAQFS